MIQLNPTTTNITKFLVVINGVLPGCETSIEYCGISMVQVLGVEQNIEKQINHYVNHSKPKKKKKKFF